MIIEFDPVKSERNTRHRHLPFERAANFEWEHAVFSEDNRFTYPERRFIALGYLDMRLHVLCFTPIENGIRVISFRKANLRERKYYEKIHKDKAPLLS